MAQGFDVSWDRITRAYERSVQFGERWSDFTRNGDVYETHVSMERDGTGTIWVERLFRELPKELSLSLGEFLYHLRAALDACIYRAAILETGNDPPPDENSLEFPICATATQFKRSAKKVRAIRDTYRLEIIESVQPFNAPPLPDKHTVYNINRALAILNDWARKDRHRKLHLVGSWASNTRPKFRLPPETKVRQLTVAESGFLEHDSVIATFEIEGWKPGMKLEANPDFTIDVGVDELPPACADNDTLGNRVRAMGVGVQSIVSEFEKSFDLSPGEPVFG